MKKLKIWTKYNISVKSEKYKGIIMPFQHQVLGMLTAFGEKQLEKNPPFDYLKKWFLQLATLEMWKATLKYQCPSPTSDQLNQSLCKRKLDISIFKNAPWWFLLAELKTTGLEDPICGKHQQGDAHRQWSF